MLPSVKLLQKTYARQTLVSNLDNFIPELLFDALTPLTKARINLQVFVLTGQLQKSFQYFYRGRGSSLDKKSADICPKFDILELFVCLFFFFCNIIRNKQSIFCCCGFSAIHILGPLHIIGVFKHNTWLLYWNMENSIFFFYMNNLGVHGQNLCT